MAGDIFERRRRAREKLLGAPTRFRHIGVEIDGEFYAVREPTVGERAAINRAATGDNLMDGKATFDLGNHQVAGMLSCVFVGEPVMEAVPSDGAPTNPDAPPTPPRLALEPIPLLDAKGAPELDAEGKPKFEQRPKVICGFSAGERVFEQGDLQALIGQPVSSFVRHFIPIVQRLMNPTMEDARKST